MNEEVEEDMYEESDPARKSYNLITHNFSYFLSATMSIRSTHEDPSVSQHYYTMIVILEITSVYLIPVFVLSVTRPVGRYVLLSSLMVDSVSMLVFVQQLLSVVFT